jgi:hypothetical protein
VTAVTGHFIFLVTSLNKNRFQKESGSVWIVRNVRVVKYNFLLMKIVWKNALNNSRCIYNKFTKIKSYAISVGPISQK